MEGFTRLRKGAAGMDQHFLTAPPWQNLSVLLGKVGYLVHQLLGSEESCSSAVLPHLRYFPAFLQQLEMESNGKFTRIDNRAVDYRISPVI